MDSYSFCFDKQHNMIIGDYTAGTFKVFSQGDLLHTLGDTQDENKTIKPTGITITCNNKFSVSLVIPSLDYRYSNSRIKPVDPDMFS